MWNGSRTPIIRCTFDRMIEEHIAKHQDMSYNNRYCIIMAGGTANHFWPVSRESRPKQFLDIAGTGDSFIRSTYERFSRIVPSKNILVVTLTRFSYLVRAQIPELPEENLLLEPYARNTAPCIAYATYCILKRDPDATVIATPADHIIKDEARFKSAMLKMMDYAENNSALMTLGIHPTEPDTSYGYIQATGGRESAGDDTPLKVKTFTEKPDKALAEVFCKTGEFYWNSGIFAWKASVIREEMEKYIPDVTTLFTGWEDALGSDKEQTFLEKVYTDCPKVSIDYGVMEKTDRAWLYCGDFGWSDIDSWESLYSNMDNKTADGNIVFTDKYLAEGNEGSMLVCGDKKKLYAIKGLKDYVVVDTGDVLLICPKDDKQFKDFISGLGMPDYEGFR